MLPSVLVVDKDLEFAFWLCAVLDGDEYEAFPARSVADAFSLLKTIPALRPCLRLLVISSAAENAEELVQYCCRDGNVPVIVLSEGTGSPAATSISCDAGLQKPAVADRNDLLVGLGRFLPSSRLA